MPFGYKFSFDPPVVSDVAQRELTVTVNAQDPPQVRTYPGDAVETDEWVFNVADAVTVTLVDIDGSGNRSPPSAALQIAVIDDVAPPQPVGLAVKSKVQI